MVLVSNLLYVVLRSSTSSSISTLLAKRAQMTNQSMGYLVDALETRGYVQRQPDPADRRAALVVITDRGRDEIAAARRLIAEIEREWSGRIGRERMASLRQALEALAESLARVG